MKMCGLILWNATAICEMLKTSWQTGKHICERRFGEPFDGPVSPFGAMVEYHPISSRDQPRLHQIGEKVLLGIFLGHVLIAENLERTHYDCGH